MDRKGLNPDIEGFLLSLGWLTLLQSAFRLGFLFSHFREFSGSLSVDIRQAFKTGFRFDLQFAALIILILYLLYFLIRLFPQARIHMRAIQKYSVLTLSAILTIIYFIDFKYYDYLGSRLDASILGLIRDSRISLAMTWQSYNIPWLVILAGILIFCYNYILKRLFNWLRAANEPQKMTRMTLVQYILFGLMLPALIYGRVSTYALQWSNAYFSQDPRVNQLTVNPLNNFIFTMNWRDEGFDTNALKEIGTGPSQAFGVLTGVSDTSGYRIYGDSELENLRPRNLIVIILETFPSYKVGIAGNPMNPTPEFDRISRKGELYLNHYVPKVSTAASIFSLLTSLPDLAISNKSSTRNPRLIHQHIPFADIDNVEKYFFVGGSANWGELNGFLSNNVPGIHIFQEGDYLAKPVNAWGISDYDLFRESFNTLDSCKAPFISLILTGSNHSPHTLPTDSIPGFNRVHFNDEWAENGFSGEAELNTFRFMDFSLGWFFDEVQHARWGRQTTIVILGDHGSTNHSCQGKSQPYAIDQDLYHVPLAVIGPGFFPGVIHDYCSENDILPSVMNRMGYYFKSIGLANDLYDRKSRLHYAFYYSSALRRYGLFTGDGVLAIDEKTHGLLNDESDPAREYYPLAREIYELARSRRFLLNSRSNEAGTLQ